MPSLNKSEYGQVVRVNLFEDVSTATDLTFVLQPKVGESLERTASNGVAIGTSNVDVGDETYLANQYLEYTILDGDLTYAGQWRIKGKAKLSATKEVISDYKRITVME